MILYEEFRTLNNSQIALMLREKQSSVCAFPINGTRRWFKLQHPDAYKNGTPSDFLTTVWQEHIRIYKLLFDHGFQTLLAPITGPDILARDASYQQLIEPGLRWLCEAPEMLDFCANYNVRVRFYGEIEAYFGNSKYAHLIELLNRLQQKTAVHTGPKLLFGICAHDATETVAKIGHTFYLSHNKFPTKADIIKAYYGVHVNSVDLFIGFDRLSVFDMPLVATGKEDLYFTIAPSLFFDKETLRIILYDHLYGRRVTEKYEFSTNAQSSFMKQFYDLNRHNIIGIGRRSEDGSFWYPLPQVALPSIVNHTAEF